MISFLIKSGLCLAILLVFYHLVLEREKMHQFNRFYLLGSVLFSFLVPFAIIYVEAPEIVPSTVNLAEVPLTNDIALTTELQPTESFNYMLLLFYAYLLISLLFLVRFLKGLFNIFQKVNRNKSIKYQNAKIVLVDDKILPYTFWNYIFINNDEYYSQKIEKELFTHELTHVTQKHTIDVLIVEVLQIVLWFNPFFYPLKKAIQLNHEFLADDYVIASHKDISKYQYLLLDKATWKNNYYLASNLNYSLTKKRLLMMKTQNSKTTIWIKKLAILPLIVGLIFLFAERVEAQNKDSKSDTLTKDIEKKLKAINNLELTYNEATEVQMEEYNSLMQKKEKGVGTINKLLEIHSIMSEEQRSSVKSIDGLTPTIFGSDVTKPILKIKKNPISKSLFEKLKDETKYVLSLDGKRIPNNKLNNYSYTDIVSYEAIYIDKITRNKSTKAFQKEYYYILRTKSQVERINKRYNKSNKDTLPRVKEIKKGISKEQMKVYKSLLNSAEEKKTFKYVNVLKLRRLYNLMSDKQKQSVKNINDLLPPPPPPRKVKVTEKKNEYDVVEAIIDEIEEVEETEIPVKDLIEIIEVPEGVEEKEVEETEELKETLIEKEAEALNTFEERIYQEKKVSLKENFEKLKKKKAVFYLDGKKVLPKKVKKYFYGKSNDIKTIDIIKNKKGKIKVKIRTK